MARTFTCSYEIGGWGTGEFWLAGGRLVWHELPRPVGAPQPTTRCEHTEKTVTGGTRNRADFETADRLERRIRRYFAGERVAFDDVPADLDWCTPFQAAVAAALRAVPYGEVVTYGELAALAGHPSAQRAVGTFCARNRLPLVLPCHRVVAADSLGSYGWLGPHYKRRLLALEGVTLE